ncbi:hypothetical protein LINPERHAP2_LOCUS22845 [Linum perenne]
MEFHTLEELTTDSQAWSIQVRVSRLWVAINSNNDKALHLDMILTDCKANAIWAQIPPTLMDHFQSNVIEQKVYAIKKFRVISAPMDYRPIRNPLSIQFSSSTTIEEVPDITSIPNGFCVKVAVWGKHATEVEDLLKKGTRVAEGKNILIITSTYVSLKKGITDLSSTGATKIYLNLDIPEAQSLKSLNGGKKPLAISNTIQMVTFKDLDGLKKDPGNKGKIYKIQCTIKDVDHGWFYWGCANDACLRRVEEGSENFICAFCNHK